MNQQIYLPRMGIALGTVDTLIHLILTILQVLLLPQLLPTLDEGKLRYYFSHSHKRWGLALHLGRLILEL